MKKRKMSIWTIVYLILILLAMAVFVLPISLAVLTSFKSKPDLAKSVIGLPETLYLKNYSEAMIRSDLRPFLKKYSACCAAVRGTDCTVCVDQRICGGALCKGKKSVPCFG